MTLFSRPQSTAYLTLAFAAALIAPLCLAEQKPAQPKLNPAAVTDAAEFVKKGRALFDQNRFNEALHEFDKALEKNPADKDARFLSGLAAYWARMPERALTYWNQVADQTPRGGDAEWDITRNRVMALSATKNIEAAEIAIDRLREIRASGKSRSAMNALGFVREHFFLEDVRAGCWEAFDERNEAPNVWSFTVARPATEKVKTDTVVALITVERASLPGGGAGYVLAEEAREGPKENSMNVRRAYKHWVQRPDYAEVRELVLNVIKGVAKPLEEKTVRPQDNTAALEQDVGGIVPPDIKAMLLDPPAEAIVAAVWRLSAVKTDVTRLARIPAEDAPALDDFMREFNAKYPYAARDASDLTERMLTVKASHLRAACEKVERMNPRGAYLEFAVLTALNTRGRDIPPRLLESFSTSKDFLVRQTTNLLLGRMGDKRGIERLLDEVASADSRGCELLHGALTELLGRQLETPPSANAESAAEKLKAWKEKLAQWRAEKLPTLEPSPEATQRAGGPYWTIK